MISACRGASGSPLGGGNAFDERFEQIRHALAGLGTDAHGIRRIDADDFLDLLADPVRVGGRQVDLVDDGQDLEALLHRGVAVGDALRLDALRGIDDQKRAITRRQRTRHLVREVDVAGRVDHVELIALAVLGVVIESDALRP